MIRIVASGVVRDGCRTEFPRLAERLVAASRAEAGNVSYGRMRRPTRRTRRLFGGMEG